MLLKESVNLKNKYLNIDLLHKEEEHKRKENQQTLAGTSIGQIPLVNWHKNCGHMLLLSSSLSRCE